jgi:hypothetical protein
MKMGMRHCMFTFNRRSERREEILDRGKKGLKQKTLWIIPLQKRWFSWKEREAYSSIERMKNILRFVSLG